MPPYYGKNTSKNFPREENDAEIEELREKVHCAVVLEQTPPSWKLDREESTKLSLKYRRGKGEILIVSHAGRG